MLKPLLLLSALILCIQLAACAQTTSSGNSATVYPSVKAKKYKILLNTGKRLVARSLDSLSRNTLYITNKKRTQAISVETINKLKIAKRKRPVLRGIAFGGLSGAAAGAIAGFATSELEDPDTNSFINFETGIYITGGAVTGFLGGMLIGGIVGAASHSYTTYNFTGQSPADKAASIARILSGQ